MISLYQVRVDNFSIYNPGYELIKAVINYNNNNINISEVYEEQKVDKNNYIKRKLKWINSLKFTGFNLIFFGFHTNKYIKCCLQFSFYNIVPKIKVTELEIKYIDKNCPHNFSNIRGKALIGNCTHIRNIINTSNTNNNSKRSTYNEKNKLSKLIKDEEYWNIFENNSIYNIIMLIESYFGPILKINNYEFINLYVEISNNSLLPNLLSYFFEYDIKHKEAGFYLYMKDKNLLKGYNLINSVYYYNQYKRYIIEHSNNLYDSIDCDVY